MFARIARYKVSEAKFGEVVPAFRDAVEQLREIDGNRGGYLLIDRDNCTATTLTFWENQAALASLQRAAILTSEKFKGVRLNLEPGLLRISPARGERSIHPNKRAGPPSFRMVAAERQ
jgi:quinol monooxygenase YgiN